VLGDREQITANDLPPQITSGFARASGPLPRATSAPTPSLGSLPSVTIDTAPRAPAPAPTKPPATAKSLRELEKEGIVAALAATGGNKAQAAAILEIDRSTLYKKLKDYDIEG
jgi:DNA-binding NtrC family response regulator